MVLIVKRQFNEECRQHQNVSWNRQVEDRVQNWWVLFYCLECGLHALTENESNYQALDDLEVLVAENMVEIYIVIESHGFAIHYEIKNVHG